MKHTFFLLEPGHRCYWWGTIESILTHTGDAFFLWCLNIPTWRNEQRAAMVVRGGIWGRKPRCTSHLKRSRKARTAGFFFFFFIANWSYRPQIPHSFETVVLFWDSQLSSAPLLSSRQYFPSTEDSNTWLSGSTQVQIPDSQLLDWNTHEHPVSFPSLGFQNHFLL